MRDWRSADFPWKVLSPDSIDLTGDDARSTINPYRSVPHCSLDLGVKIIYQGPAAAMQEEAQCEIRDILTLSRLISETTVDDPEAPLAQPLLRLQDS